MVLNKIIKQIIQKEISSPNSYIMKFQNHFFFVKHEEDKRRDNVLLTGIIFPEIILVRPYVLVHICSSECKWMKCLSEWDWVGKISLLGDFVNIYHHSLLYHPAMVFVISIFYMMLLWDISCSCIMLSKRQLRPYILPWASI